MVPLTARSAVELPGIARSSPLETLLAQRRSLRAFAPAALTLPEVARLLWAAQGLTDPQGRRTAPSAGALYPLELSVAVGQVEGLPAGIYRYRPQGHALLKVADGDARARLAAAALAQECVAQGALVLAIAAIYARTLRKYGERGIRYVHLEAGHAAQNVCLQAVALGLGTVPIGAFDDHAVQHILGLPHEAVPLYLMPVGRPASA